MDVKCFLKNGGDLFYGSTNPKLAMEWVDLEWAILTHMGYPPELWVRMATWAMKSMGKL